MRVTQFLCLAACGLYLSAMAAIAQAQGVKVDVNAGGVRVNAATKGMRNASTGIVRADDVIGLSVDNTAGESLGKIEDLVIDPATGKIRYAVLSVGGLLGIGDKYVAVPWDKLSLTGKGETKAGMQEKDRCILDVSKETLKNAPTFDKAHWPNFSDANWTSTNDRHYGSQGQSAGERKSQR